MSAAAPSSEIRAARRDSVLALVLANLVPLAGVVLLDWSVSSVLILYWFENVVLGVINVVRIATAVPPSGTHVQKLFLVPFFIVHYFGFCAAHGIFLFAMFGDTDGYFPASDNLGLFGALSRAVEIFRTPLAFAAVALILSHAYSFVTNYWFGGEYRRLGARELMSMPYQRIVVLHVTIILGGFAAMALATPIWPVLVLVLVKIAVDLKLHVAEHRRIAGAKPGST